jgi:hypothetical protein
MVEQVQVRLNTQELEAVVLVLLDLMHQHLLLLVAQVVMEHFQLFLAHL